MSDWSIQLHGLREMPPRVLMGKFTWRLAKLARRLTVPAPKKTVPPGEFAARPFLTTPGHIAAIAAWCREHRPESVKHQVALAEEITAGEIPIFRFGRVRLDPAKPDWRDRSNFTRWRLLGRHDFLVVLALTYACDGRELFRTHLLDYLSDWLGNDSGRGAERSLDAANRLVNWAWLRQFPGLLESKPELWPAWVGSVRAAVTHVRRLLSPGGNHLAFDALGLWAAGLAHPELPEAGHWRDLGRRILIDVAAEQFGDDGFHLERTTSYHLHVTRVLLDFYLSARQAGIELPDRTRQVVLRACRAAWAFRFADGSYPLLSDSDGFCAAELDHWRHRMVPTAVANAFSDRPGDHLAPWYFGTDRRDAPASEAAVELRPDGGQMFPEAGYAILRKRVDRGESMLVFDGGRLGLTQHPHHGHADALSLVLQLEGQPLLIDPGAYAYRDDPLRHWIRSTKAHNTIRVGGLDQSEVSGALALGYQARARFTDHGEREAGDFVAAEVRHHRGHPDHPVHRRCLALSETHSLLVLDEVRAKPGALVELLWHCHPDIEAEQRDGIWHLSSGTKSWFLATRASQELTWTRHRGVEGDRPQGWYVADALNPQPCNTLCATAEMGADGRMVLATVIGSIATLGDTTPHLQLETEAPPTLIYQSPAEHLRLGFNRFDLGEQST